MFELAGHNRDWLLLLFVVQPQKMTWKVVRPTSSTFIALLCSNEAKYFLKALQFASII